MNNKRPSQPGFTHIKELIDQIIGKCHISNNTEFLEIQRIWNRLLNSEITDHAQPATFKNGVLFIHVKSSTLTHQLMFQTKEITKQINHAMGEERISIIKFKIR